MEVFDKKRKINEDIKTGAAKGTIQQAKRPVIKANSRVLK